MKLNPQQIEAVRYLGGPLLVLAGAGSGKTGVITQKIKHLIVNVGYLPHTVAAITFTNKAATEMQERVAKMLPKSQTRGLTICTFHSLGMKILREEANHIGYKKNFSILDSTDSAKIIGELLGGTGKEALFKAQHQISLWKNDLLTPEQYARAGGLVQLASASQYLISPAIAGLLMASSGITTVLTIDIATMVLTVACMLLVWRTVKTPPRRTTTGFWADFRQGISFLRQHSGITVLMALITVVTFCMGFLQTLLTPMLLDLTDESTLGAVRSVAAVGMIVASLIIGVFNMKGAHLTYITCFLAAGGVLIFLLGTTTSILAIGVLAFAFFMTLPPLNTSVEVIARSSIPNETQGKVWGLMGLISQLGYVVAYAVSGVLADSVFNPLLREGGALADSLGALIGVGTSRGIGFMLMIVGVLLIGMAVAIPRARSIRSLQNNLPLTEKKGV